MASAGSWVASAEVGAEEVSPLMLPGTVNGFMFVLDPHFSQAAEARTFQIPLRGVCAPRVPTSPPHQ